MVDICWSALLQIAPLAATNYVEDMQYLFTVLPGTCSLGCDE